MILRRFTGAARLNSLILFCFSPFSEGFFLYVQVPYARDLWSKLRRDRSPRECRTFLPVNSGQCLMVCDRYSGLRPQVFILGAGHDITPRPERYLQYRLAKTDTRMDCKNFFGVLGYSTHGPLLPIPAI